jgi:uncharacterized membrane protein YbhN (UPF0104 family)
VSNNLRLLVSGLLLAVVAWRMSWSQAAQTFAQVRVELWAAAVVLYVLTQIVSGWRWQILARPLGFERPLWQYTGFYFVGMYFNLVLPTSVGGDVVRAWYLDGQSGRRLSAFLSVFVDRLSGLVVLVALAVAASVLSPIDLSRWMLVCVWGAAAALLFGMATLPLLARYPLLGDKYAKLGAEVRDSFALILRPLPLALSLVVQSANVVLVWLVGLALGVSVPAAYYWVLVPMVTLLTMAPVSINGVGVREGAMIAFLGPLGVPAAAAVSLSLLWFSVFTTASLLGGAVYLFGRFPRPERGAAHGPVCHHPDQGRAGERRAAA